MSKDVSPEVAHARIVVIYEAALAALKGEKHE
jgi:hypothetical protein